MGLLSRVRQFAPVSMDVLRGRAVYTRDQFKAVDKDIHTNHNTPVERCVAAMNKNLIANYQVDCSNTIVRIGRFPDDVLDAALEAMRDQGGWTITFIDRGADRTILSFR